MPGLLHESQQDAIDEARRLGISVSELVKMRQKEEEIEKLKNPCKKCGELRILTNEGLCYDCLYLETH